MGGGCHQAATPTEVIALMVGIRAVEVGSSGSSSTRTVGGDGWHQHKKASQMELQ